MTLRPACSAICLAALVVAGLGGCRGLSLERTDPHARPVVLSYAGEDGLGFSGHRALAEAVSPSYVRVVIEDPDAAAEGGGRDADGKALISAASGVIVDASGLVVTAAHIAIDTRFKARVITLDGRSHPARILAVEPARELAVLRIRPFAGMAVAAMADSDGIEVGQAVLAIGTPGNRPGVVSLGRVVEAKHRRRLAYNGYGFDDGVKLHIDIEPGHSGGPVFDRRGALIGIIATFVLGDTTDPDAEAPHLAYAVPSNAMRAYLAAIGLR